MAVLQTLGGDTTWPSPKRIQKTNTEKTQKNIGGYGTHNKNNFISTHQKKTEEKSAVPRQRHLQPPVTITAD